MFDFAEVVALAVCPLMMDSVVGDGYGSAKLGNCIHGWGLATLWWDNL